MITVVARLRTVDGKAGEFEAAAREQIAAVGANEAGKALVYTLHRSQKDPNLFMFYEQYSSEDALTAHGATDHMKALGGKLRGVLDGRPEIERYDSLAAL